MLTRQAVVHGRNLWSLRRLGLLGLLGLALPLLSACGPHGRGLAAPEGVSRADQVQAVVATPRVWVGATDAGTLLVSVDQGRVWQRQRLPGTVSIIDLQACPDGSLLALDFYRKLWVAGPDAQAWQARALPGRFTPLALSCRSDGTAWVVGSEATVLATADRGQTWQDHSLHQDAMLRTVQFLGAQQGFVLGEFGLVLGTRDGGRSWQRVGALPEDFYPYAAHFDNANTGWASGVAGTVLATRDGGKTWQAQANATGAALYALVKREGQLYGLGDGGQVVVLNEQRWEPAGAVRGAAWLAAATDLGRQGVLTVGPQGLVQVLKPEGRKVAQ